MIPRLPANGIAGLRPNAVNLAVSQAMPRAIPHSSPKMPRRGRRTRRTTLTTVLTPEEMIGLSAGVSDHVPVMDGRQDSGMETQSRIEQEYQNRLKNPVLPRQLMAYETAEAIMQQQYRDVQHGNLSSDSSKITQSELTNQVSGLRIHSSMSTELTLQRIQDDGCGNKHNINYRGEYASHPYQPSNSLFDGPLSPRQDSSSLMLSNLENEAKNQGDIASALYRANQIYRDNRPRNTRIMYNRKQIEWSEWCLKERKFKDKDTVYEGKLVLWLEERVIPRGNNSRGTKRGTKLSVSGLEAYVKPIVALYEVYFFFFFHDFCFIW